MKLGSMSLMAAWLAGASLALAQPTSPPPGPPAGPAPEGTAPGGPLPGGPLPGGPLPGPGFDATGPGPCVLDGTDGAVIPPLYRTWFDASYLLWRLTNANLPPTQLFVPFQSTGFNTFVTSVQFPNGPTIDYSEQNGMRFNAGIWCDPYCKWGVEADYFTLERGTTNFVASQANDVPLAVFINQIINQAIITPGGIINTIANLPIVVNVPSRLTFDARGSGSADLWGYELNVRSGGLVFGPLDADFLAGFRHIQLEEDLELTSQLRLTIANTPTLPPQVIGTIPPAVVPPLPAPPPGFREAVRVVIFDKVSTKNEIYLGQVGTKFDMYFGKLFLHGAFKFGAGGARQYVNIAGATAGFGTDLSNLPGITPGGLFTPTNGIDEFSRTRYILVPEWNLRVGCQLFSWMQVYVGYDIMGIYNVVRPGDQIAFAQSQTTINLAGTISNTTIVQPGFRWMDSDIWINGFNFGVNFRW